MIRLKNISTIPLTGTMHLSKNSNISSSNIKFIIDNRLFDYEKLLENVENNLDNLPCKDDKLKKRVLETIDQISVSSLGVIPEVHEFKDIMGFDSYSIDNSVSDSSLLYSPSFLSEIYDDFNEFKNYFDNEFKILTYGLNVFELKQLLSHCDVDGKNLLKQKLFIGNLYSDQEIKKIIYSIELYNEQLKRQYEENSDQKENKLLFYLNREEKQKLIRSKIEDIIKEFILADELVWGKVTKLEKELFEGMLNKKDGFYLSSRENLIRILSNYVSLTEAKDDKVKQKIINRFILK